MYESVIWSTSTPPHLCYTGSCSRIHTLPDRARRPLPPPAARSEQPMTRTSFRLPLALLAVLALAAVACNLVGLSAQNAGPSVAIAAPDDGATLPVDEPVTVVISAEDLSGAGIASVDFYADGALIATEEAAEGPGRTVTATFEWTPSAEGEISLMAIAYREDATASVPATIGVTVVGMTVEPTADDTTEPGTEEPEATEETAEPGTEEPQATEAGDQPVEGQANTQTAIRSGPGPFCPQIGILKNDDKLNLLEYSYSDLWLETDYLGPEDHGWVYLESIDILGDESLIPHGDERGCIGCGDGVCNGTESCETCPGDCGECCGNGICQAQFGEDCGTCEADCGACCGNGTCEADRGEDCETCEDDCGACATCGDDSCDADYGEDCETCEEDCGECPFCGDDSCDDALDEYCDTCPADCGACCGDGVCNADHDESCSTCPADCGACEAGDDDVS